ncbi:MAG: alpha/beta hydrolase [Bacteroidota bacterium]
MVFVLLSVSFFIGYLIYRAEKGSRLYEFKVLVGFWYQLFTHKIERMEEARYRYGKHWRQYFLLVKPKREMTDREHVILYFHGGGWRLGKPEFFRVHAKLFAERGYHVIMPSHRRIPLYSYQHMREDLNLLMPKIDEVLAQHGLQDKQIILGGASSGANLAAHMLYHRAELHKQGWSQDRFAGIFLLAAPLDLSKMEQSFVLESYVGWQKEASIEAASPITYLEAVENTPVLCVHGAKDGIVAYDTTCSFVEKMRTINPDIIQFHTLEGGTHLDVSRWGYRMDELQTVLLEWIERFEVQ